jgi:hypothetical protein
MIFSYSKRSKPHMFSTMLGAEHSVQITTFWLITAMLVSCQLRGGAIPNPELEAASGPPVVVIGFVGGFIRHDNPAHGGVQLAALLRKEHPSGVYVRVFENHRREEAHEVILRLLDTNHDGKLSDEEKQKGRIIIYGHSWGGSETVALAKVLQSESIPVLLTVQVDSVAKIGEDDSLIPPNVAEAVNYYQTNGILHGRARIRAADPSRTQIIGNYHFDYGSHQIRCEGRPWYAYVFTYPHLAIECDPTVLKQIEALIRSKLPEESNSPTAPLRHPRAKSLSRARPT